MAKKKQVKIIDGSQIRKSFTARQNISITGGNPKIYDAVKILAALMKMTKIKSYIRYKYDIKGIRYELMFIKRNKKEYI